MHLGTEERPQKVDLGQCPSLEKNSEPRLVRVGLARGAPCRLQGQRAPAGGRNQPRGTRCSCVASAARGLEHGALPAAARPAGRKLGDLGQTGARAKLSPHLRGCKH